MKKVNHIYHIAKVPEVTLTEEFKGEITLSKEEKMALKGLSPHPFKYETTQKLYEVDGRINAAIDKYVDFTVGQGFYVTSKDERAATIITQFLQDTSFDIILRRWFRQALIKGSSPLELGGSVKKGVEGLKILNADNIYVKRDKKGNILKYVQKTGQLTDEGIEFEPAQIAFLTINTPEDACYGLGIVYPVLRIINNILGCEKDMHMLLRRKANSPIHIQLGNMDKEDIPTTEELDNFSNQLVYLNNKQEWTTGPNVNMKVIDFGNLGEKFDFVLRHDTQMLYHSLQIPEVLMGSGNIAEGLGSVQTDAMMRRISSFQAEIEKIVEEQIFKRVLLANGIQEHVEFEWGQPSKKESNERIVQITALLNNLTLHPELHKALQMELADLLKIKVELKDDEEERANEEDNLKQPLVPGELRDEEKTLMIYNKVDNLKMIYEGVLKDDKLICGKCRKTTNAEEITQLVSYKCMNCGTVNQTNNITIREWLGFNYKDYLTDITEFIKKDDFEKLLAKTETERSAGKLSESQVNKLKNILITKFREGSTIREIQEEIKKQLRLKDLYAMKDGDIKRDDKGEPIVQIYSGQRANMIARTESTRVSAEGALLNYEKNGLQKVQFSAAMSNRTCETCMSFNGKVYTIEESRSVIPYQTHVYCRCGWLPIISE